jgi:hypothetical protein
MSTGPTDTSETDDKAEVSSDSTKSSTRAAGPHTTGTQRKVIAERNKANKTNPPRAGHAVEPPPVIRPKSKPQRATGAVKPVTSVGDDESAKAEDSGDAVEAPTPTAGAKEKRTFRTAKTSAGVTPPETPTALASPATPTPAPEPDAKPTFAAVAAGGVEASGIGTATKGPKGARKIKLNLSYVSPLSVMKISFLVSIAAGIAFVVMVFVLWNALDAKNVFVTIDDMIREVVGGNPPESLQILNYVDRGKIMSGAAMIAVIDVVIATVLATLGAVVYNIIAALVGGVHVTLKED